MGGTVPLHGCTGDDLETEKVALPYGENGQLHWYLDIEHKEFHPLAKWEEFIADPGKYLNGMIEGEFEE